MPATLPDSLDLRRAIMNALGVVKESCDFPTVCSCPINTTEPMASHF